MQDIFNPPKILSLSELTAGISMVISQNFTSSVWVKAELSKLNHYPESGHCYPALVEKEKGAVRAEMRGMIWANDFLRINQKFLQVTREPLREGIHILFRAMVKFHSVYGLSLQISDIDPTYTLGEMARERLETINRLKKEGVFDANKMVPLPRIPKRIAIISVKTSKGFSDFMSILRSNQWGYAFSCYLFPALLQGDKAVESILGQLQTIRSLSGYFDAVAIIRGGGGDVGLNCYDNYTLAKEVAIFPIPVLTGIGHSTNETVVEMVSGRNLITPTDVAYFILQQYHNFAVRLEELSRSVMANAITTIEEGKKEQGELARRLLKETAQLMGEEKYRVERLSRGLAAETKDLLHGQQLFLNEMESHFKAVPLQMLRNHSGRLDRVRAMLELQLKQLFVRNKMKIDRGEEQIRLLDPVNVLKRGYSIAFLDGKVLKDSSGAVPGSIITTRLYKGTVYSEIKSKSD